MSIDPTSAADRLESIADEPAAVTSDGQSATNQPIPDLIELHRYASGREALSGSNDNGGPKSGWRCVRMAKGTPPGAS